MKKLNVVMFLVIGLVLSISAAEANNYSGYTNLPISLTSPPLSAFINIWLETGVDNIEPAVAYNSLHDEYLVVWSNTRSGGSTKDIYARRVRGDGTLLSNFTITHNANFHNYQPDVAYSPIHDEYLVVWTYDSAITDDDIWARRVKWDGSWMGSEFSLGRKTAQQHYPAVTYNSQVDEYLVVYQNTWGGGGQDIDVERVRAGDGTPLGWINIAAGGGFRSFPDVTYNNTSNLYLIAYTFKPSSISDPGDIYAKVANWNMGDMSPEIHICDDAHGQGAVAVAAGRGGFLVVWEDIPNATTTELYARRLSSSGEPLGPSGGFWITGSPSRYDEEPDVAFGASGSYLITWHRFMGGVDYNVYGRYVAPGRDIAVGGEFAIDNDVLTQMHPVVACSISGDCLMVEEDNNSVGGDFEIRGRLMYSYNNYLPITVRNH